MENPKKNFRSKTRINNKLNPHETASTGVEPRSTALPVYPGPFSASAHRCSMCSLVCFPDPHVELPELGVGVHAVTGALKSFMKLLPDPLIPEAYQKPIHDAMGKLPHARAWLVGGAVLGWPPPPL